MTLMNESCLKLVMAAKMLFYSVLMLLMLMLFVNVDGGGDVADGYGDIVTICMSQ